jgi:hypothetical protein
MLLEQQRMLLLKVLTCWHLTRQLGPASYKRRSS